MFTNQNPRPVYKFIRILADSKEKYKRKKIKNLKIYFKEPILNIFVPHVGHVPETASLPFFNFLGTGFFICFFALHFTQYASTILLPPLNVIHANAEFKYINLFLKTQKNLFFAENLNTTYIFFSQR
jgi:hypothetical protein